MQAFEISHFRGIAGFHQRFVTRLDEGGAGDLDEVVEGLAAVGDAEAAVGGEMADGDGRALLNLIEQVAAWKLKEAIDLAGLFIAKGPVVQVKNFSGEIHVDGELAGFAAQHADYDAEKYIDILAKTARKMSPTGRAAAAALPLAEPFASLLARALLRLPKPGG